MSIHGQVWSILETVFLVPADPPTLPATGAGRIVSFRPASGFLSYLRLWFWIACLPFDGALLVAWVFLARAHLRIAIALLPLALAIGVVPEVAAWIAIRLRFDTTWYVLSDRSLRIRRGIFVLREATITFENVQNVKIKQGPIQRRFGISNLLVETAGGGGSDDDEGGGAHTGLIEGVADAPRIRDMILDRAKRSAGSGIGDDESAPWTDAHVACLRAIRNDLDALAGGSR